MSVKYQDPSYANDRLGGCVVQYEGKPVYVEYIDEEGQANITYTGNRRGHRFFHVDYMELDLTPVKLGNVNVGSGVAYVKRIPKRRDWRQGLRANNFDVLCYIGYNEVTPMSKCLINTIMGIYPTIDECINAIECGEVEGMAFGRHFAISTKTPEGYQLFYRTKPVGHIKPSIDGSYNYSFNEEYIYLKELLQEEMRIG